MIEKTLSTIDKIYEQAQRSSLTVDKTNWADKTYSDYCSLSRKIVAEIYEKYGIYDLCRIRPSHTLGILEDRISKGQSAYTLNNVPHALEALKTFANKTNCYNRKVSICNKEEMLSLLKEREVERKIADSTSLRSDFATALKVIENIEDSRVRAIAKIQLATGGRIDCTLRLKVSYLDLEGGTVLFYKDKGSLTRVVKFDPFFRAFMEGLVKEKKSGSPLFDFKSVQNSEKSLSAKSAKNIVNREVRKAAEKAGVGGDGKNFTTHSFRKAFSQKRLDYYKNLSREELLGELKWRIENSQHKNGKSVVVSKILNEHYKFNRYRISKGLKKKALDNKVLARFLLSCDIGHFRSSSTYGYASY